MEWVVIGIYASFLLFILMYSISQFHLVVLYLKGKNRQTIVVPKVDDWPMVTIQLPIYNEKYVCERLIDQVVKLDYPQDKLEIQVLDDSTDDSVEIISQRVNFWKEKGVDIVHVRRKDRVGYKAGALAYGNTIAKGIFIAIFDADFLPKASFLKETIPFFEDNEVGVVQTRWEHLNANYSYLTRLQAFGLDAHFTVEQGGRSEGNHFINFNGTAGVWRKSCIEDAGGWQSDTLTEDLDLSYRAQGKGWRFVYLENVGSPAELPIVMSALKSQQYRWTKGAAETIRKNLKGLLRNKELGFWTKFHGFFHLSNSMIFLCIIGLAFLSIPVLWVKHSYADTQWFFKIAAILVISFVFLSIFYLLSRVSIQKNKSKALKEFVTLFPFFLSVSMGLSLHNAIAVVEGLIGRKTPFVRTPKFNVGDEKGDWKKNVYLKSTMSWLVGVEFLMGLYSCLGIVLAFYWKDFGMVIFHLMLLIGSWFVAFYTWKDQSTKERG